MKVGLLCSGNLGFQMLQKLRTEHTLAFVFCDSGSAAIVDYCREENIPLFKGNPRGGKCAEFLADKACEVLLSVNYLFLIDEQLISFPSKLAVNVHGSLLPKYRGRTPHVWAIINNEQKTGITAHVIDSGCDTGDILEQVEIEIDRHDTGASILGKFNEAYWPLIKKVLRKMETGQLVRTPQDHTKATYFGKRTPEDGLIDWNWQKERIYNWVRAQATPYPGAYTFMNGQKITVDRISFTDDGFDFATPNGTVLAVSPLKIKTRNGVIQIDELREQIGNMDVKDLVLG